MGEPLSRITVLGATGSIGVSTLDVISRHPQRYQVYALTARSRVEALAEQCRRFSPRFAVVAEEPDAERLRALLADTETEVLAGEEALVAVAGAEEVDTVMAAIVGFAGLLPTLAAVRAGKKVLLANKEALVTAGRLFMDTVAENNAVLLPIDSEHNAVFQCLPFSRGTEVSADAGVSRIILTASGGPFRGLPAEAMAAVTPDQACAHPNWAMGRKISVDSATMMNKGLELIEAHWLFGVEEGRIDVVVHPQSVIHSMVEYADGSILAQLGQPDMRTPIAHALAWPQRMASGVSGLDLLKLGPLEFEAPDEVRFPCLRLAREALRAGGSAAVALNAANEVAVEAFLQQRLSFDRIAVVCEQVMEAYDSSEPATLVEVQDADRQARGLAQALLA